jgi:hypothetical protein
MDIVGRYNMAVIKANVFIEEWNQILTLAGTPDALTMVPGFTLCCKH